MESEKVMKKEKVMKNKTRRWHTSKVVMININTAGDALCHVDRNVSIEV